MSTAKTVTIEMQIEIPAPPDTHFLLPQEWKGKVKFQREDMVYSAVHGWYELYPDGIWKNAIAVARLRPRNPQNLSDDVFRKLPMDARALSDDELERFEKLGGLVVEDEKLLGFPNNFNVWSAGFSGGYTKDYAYATLHPANYYLELPDSAFVWGKKKLAAPMPPEGCELVEDLDYVIKEGDWVWLNDDKVWEPAEGCIGMTVKEAAGNGEHSDCAYVARPKAKPVWNPENLPQEALDKVPEGERLLSKSEHGRLVKKGGLRVAGKHTLRSWQGKEWWARGKSAGDMKYWTYCTPHPEGYFDTLPDSEFKDYVKPKVEAAKPVFHDESFNNTYNKPKAEEEEDPEEQHPEEDTTQDRPHTFGSCPRHGFVRMKGCREVRPFCITEKGITPFQRAFRDWKTAMNVLEYSLDGHKWGKFAQKGAK